MIYVFFDVCGLTFRNKYDTVKTVDLIKYIKFILNIINREGVVFNWEGDLTFMFG